MATEYDGDHLDFQGGKFTGPFTAKAEYREHAPAPSALDALPARAVGFTGRDGELRALLDAFDPSDSDSDSDSDPDSGSDSGAAPEAVVVAAVSGLGGIGKTALAVQAGHEACAKGWFPGGVLFLDLHGYDEEPVTAEQALEALLRALGTEPEHIPARADERAALYRSALADRARERGPVLVLADNASSPTQVRSLLPGSDTGHRLLVTSRDRLPQLGARLMALDELTPEEAYELLDRALRIAHPADSRVADDPESVTALATLCGHLPLALQIAAALLVVDRGKPVEELATELTESRDRLDHLDDGERSVRAAFDLSYRRLPPEQARVLRLLALAPGPDASDEVVAALVGTDTPPVRALEALARAHLVERGSGRRRWRLHDLVRVFGVGVVAGDAGLVEEGEAARGRVLDFYYSWADAADDWLRWFPGLPVPWRFGGRGESLGWLDGERAGLVEAVGWGEQERFADTAWRLAECLGVYLEWRRYFDDCVGVGRAGLKAAVRAGDYEGEASAWNNLGNALREAGRVAEAVEAHTRARDLCQASGDRHQEAIAWNNLGIALREAGRVAEAVEAHTRARDLYQAAGDRHREASAWNNLGIALREAGRVAEAVEAHTRARDLFQAAGDRHREASAWNNLGLALQEAGRVAEAIGGYGRALEVYREFEDWHNTGQVLHNLARAHEAAGRAAEARVCWLQAADAFTRAGDTAEADRARTRAEEQQ
ncbi:tetratricopeptide repeat protein [Streptomyces sp. WI04-05B]|uniref:tetratricopeptide repeat protein n=1 Tax=Streptomyces TaxID=1883 RepID=UPI0029A34A2C|nr:MULTISPECIES: tetratricopeptide repeat protein [unclassified Streptomyces]MDX2547022.1 tetratricopeptide repeat protein [Streptomyces sp. WI04-05B]MDX2589711.1 tetratricopeptide repeat protein [Streptomyces sp. WI04-05A]MDX3753161.1 tetratricopeptide repeat protein [Streptomyces sp. AK08-02]